MIPDMINHKNQSTAKILNTMKNRKPVAVLDHTIAQQQKADKSIDFSSTVLSITGCKNVYFKPIPCTQWYTKSAIFEIRN